MDKEILVANLYFQAVFPVMKVLLQDDPVIAGKFAKVKTDVVFKAKTKEGRIGCKLHFDHGEFGLDFEDFENGNIVFSFGTVEKMNTFLKGGTALPKIKGLTKPALLAKVIGLLLSLKLMMPNVNPKAPLKKYLKVKMALSMVTMALSKLNRLSYPDMAAWTKSQPDRVYQLSVNDTDIAVYLRVKAGKTKAGKGLYQRRRPFVHMKFSSVDAALKILLREAGFVEGVDKGYVSIDGSPEYAAQLNDLMMRVQTLTT
ncbi:MAG: hypothetical protein IEMM0006_1642 [bacterium]|nr:MAG: hypothetical protein IEMM0006_1642 [bacterium]